MKRIAVNAIACKESGALNILIQFIESVYVYDKSNIYYFFVDKSVCFTSKARNVILIKKKNLNFVTRLTWDYYGLNKWLKERNIKINIGISLQNTSFRIANCENYFIYFHQFLSLLDFAKKETGINGGYSFFYEKIYPILMQYSLKKNTKVIVQLEYVKDLFSKKFKVPLDDIFVIRPNAVIPNICIKEKLKFDDKKHFFYPATCFKYKNHKLILDCLNLLNVDKLKNIKVHFTCTKEELLKNIKIIDDKIENSLVFHGKLNYDEVLKIYKSVDCLLFPSLIETFGLPLIEAASLGIPILVVDLPYSREVLEGYEGAKYISYLADDVWATEILKLSQGKRYNALQLPKKISWDVFFDIIFKD